MMYPFATGNKNKLKEARSILGEDLESIQIDLIEIQDIDPLKVLEHKAKEAFIKIGKPVIIEDTSLLISSMCGLPGPFIKWFLQSVQNKGLIQMTDSNNRNAIALCYVAVYNGENIIYGKGEVEGIISKEERGENGFGWDTIFIPKGSEKTFAEMDLEEKNRFSMRKLAFEDFYKQII